MPDSGMRARVARLLRQTFSADDLTRLFLFARDRCDGREAVQEIGDFVAHKAERNKGFITREARDWSHVAFFMMFMNGPPPDNLALPSSFVPWLRATLRRARASDRQLPTHKAKKVTDQIEAKIITNADGSVSLANLSENEIDFINKLTARFVVRPAFTCDDLFAGFKATLKSNGLLQTDEFVQLSHVKRHICLFAVSVMHGCTIDLGNNLKTTLMLSDPVRGGPISIQAPIPVPNPKGPPMSISTALFATEIVGVENFTPALIAIPQPWLDFEVELTPAGVLDRLG